MKHRNASMRLRIVFLAVLVCSELCGPVWAYDCRARGNDGTGEIIKFDCELSGSTSSPIKIHTSAGFCSLKLVDPESSPGVPNPLASRFRVRYTDASGHHWIKAIGKIPPGISNCDELQMIGYHPLYPADGTYSLGTEILCYETNPEDARHAASLWGKGYYEYYQHKGFDRIAGTRDDNITDLSLANLGDQGFRPLGNSGNGGFRGNFNGNAKTIGGLVILRPSENYVGLFGLARGATIQNVGMDDCNISGGEYFVGGLAGLGTSISITGSYVTGSVSGQDYVGGLVGRTDSNSTMTHSYATGSVTGDGSVGGLVGYNWSSNIIRSYATNSVTGVGRVGGLVGDNVGSSSIVNSYALGAVSGGTVLGGLVGNGGGSVLNSYATGSVTGNNQVGGLIGSSAGAGVNNSFSTGSVISSGHFVGGFVGLEYCGGPILNNAWVNSASSCGIGQVCSGWSCRSLSSQGYGIDFSTIDAFYPTTCPVYQNSATSPAPDNAWSFYDPFTNPDGVWKADPGALPYLKWQDG